MGGGKNAEACIVHKGTPQPQAPTAKKAPSDSGRGFETF